MLYTHENELGNITLSRNIIGDIIINAAESLGGKVSLCNSKGKAGVSEIKSMTFMEVRQDDDGLVIRIYILMKFGAGISSVSASLINDVTEKIKAVLGKEPKQVSIVIKGVVSKNVSKRNIEVNSDEL